MALTVSIITRDFRSNNLVAIKKIRDAFCGFLIPYEESFSQRS